MPTERVVFEFLAPAGSGAAGGGSGTSPKTDTGPPVNGIIHAVRFESAGSADTGAPDTGADLQLFLQQRESDTGDGVMILNDNDILGADRYWMPRNRVTLDTGDSTNITNLEPVAAANERLRLRIVPGSAGIRGRFYVWVRDLR